MSYAPRFLLALALLSTAALPFSTAAAQCALPDNLDTAGCCSLVPATLPAFPQALIPGLGICYDQCTPNAQIPFSINWSPPSVTTCAQYSAAVKVIDTGSGVTVLGGKMLLDYTRTWMEIEPSGLSRQVWRFVVKADLASTSPVGFNPPCYVPNCLPPSGPHGSAFFYGYLDYSRLCGSAAFQESIVLYHAGDFLIHTAGLSDRPGAFHPNRSVALVAPHTTVQPFIPGVLPHPGGLLTGEATRELPVLGTPPICHAEEPIAGGSLVPLAGGCFCPLSFAPTQHTISAFAGKGTCVNPLGLGSNFQALNISFPLIPWPFMVSASLGTWSNPNVWPGKEAVWADEGLFQYYESCSNQSYYEVFYGATTTGGFTAVSLTPGIVITQNFVDLVDNFSAPIAGPYILPLFGSTQPSNHLIYVNVP